VLIFTTDIMIDFVKQKQEENKMTTRYLFHYDTHIEISRTSTQLSFLKQPQFVLELNDVEDATKKISIYNENTTVVYRGKEYSRSEFMSRIGTIFNN